MNLDQQIETELKKIGALHTLDAMKKLEYLNQVTYLMQEYSTKHKGKFYEPKFCYDCKSLNQTGAKGWGSIL